MAQLYIDLDEIDAIFAGRWLWSVNRRNLAEFRRRDFLGPAETPLSEAVRARVMEVTGRRPAGPVRLLTHVRYAGYSFNPVSFYYCFGADSSTLECIVAEITNTPWRERHAYVLPVEAAEAKGRSLESIKSPCCWWRPAAARAVEVFAKAAALMPEFRNQREDPSDRRGAAPTAA